MTLPLLLVFSSYSKLCHGSWGFSNKPTIGGFLSHGVGPPFLIHLSRIFHDNHPGTYPISGKPHLGTSEKVRKNSNLKTRKSFALVIARSRKLTQDSELKHQFTKPPVPASRCLLIKTHNHCSRKS